MPLFPALRVLDKSDEILIVDRRLPHWSQAGTICFITFRAHDSMPVAVVEQWRKDRMLWLRRHGIDPTVSQWKAQFLSLEPALQAEFHESFSDRWHDELDRCHGACVLRTPEFANIVAASLKHFDGQRYDLTDFVVMPNHVHLMAAFVDEQQMLAQCESWKHFTASQINRRLGMKGRFWQQDGFDHLVRSVEQFEHLRWYIANNPQKARLPSGEYVHFTK